MGSFASSFACAALVVGATLISGPMASAAKCAPSAAQARSAGTHLLPSLASFDRNSQRVQTVAPPKAGVVWRAVGTYDEVQTMADPDTAQVTVQAYPSVADAAQALRAADPFRAQASGVAALRLATQAPGSRSFEGSSTYGVPGQSGVILTLWTEWRTGSLLWVIQMQTEWIQVVNPRSERRTQSGVLAKLMQHAVAEALTTESHVFAACTPGVVTASAGAARLHHVGQAVALAAPVGRLEVQVTKANVASELQNPSDIDYSQYAPSGKEFVVVTLRIDATNKPVPAADLHLVLTAGKAKYKVNGAAGVALGSDSYPQTLAQAKVVVERFAFVVPAATKRATLVTSLGHASASFALPM